MTKLPALKAKDVIKVLNKLGFIEIRQKGSHKFFKHPDGRTTVVPYHPGEDISDVDIKPEEFLKILRKK
mgnify:CR=1 FL=1